MHPSTLRSLRERNHMRHRFEQAIQSAARPEPVSSGSQVRARALRMWGDKDVLAKGLWARVKRDQGPEIDVHLKLRHYVRFLALCQQSRERNPALPPAHLDVRMLTAAIFALAFEDQHFQEAVSQRLDVNKDGMISWDEYIRSTSALDQPGSKLKFIFECHDTDYNHAMSYSELCTMFEHVFGFANDAGRETLQDIVRSMVCDIYREAGRGEDESFPVDEVVAIANRRAHERVKSRHVPSSVLMGQDSAPVRARSPPTVPVWDLFGETLGDTTAAQHRRLNDIVRRAARRDVTIAEL